MATAVSDNYTAASGAAIYAGRVIPFVPAWLTGKPLNQWFEIPNTAVASLVTVNRGAVGIGIFADFNGAVLKEDTGEVIGFGGGHAGSSINVVTRLPLLVDVPAWSVKCEPNIFSEVVPAIDAQAVTPAMLWWGAVGNKKPNPPHTYNSGSWCAPLNAVVWCGNFAPNTYAGSVSNYMFRFNWAAESWQQPGSVGELGDAPAAGRVTTKDTAGIIYLSAGEAVYKFNGALAIGSQWSLLVTNGALNYNTFAALVYDSLRHRLLRIGNSFGAVSVVTIACSDGAFQDVNSLLNGDSGVLSAMRLRVNVDTCGACYDPYNDRYIVPTGLVGGAFYAINPVSWLVTLEAPLLVSGSFPATHAGTYNRIFIVPQIKAVVHFPRADANAWVMRLAA